MIYTVTLNPAMDKTVVIGRFAPDAVNRVETMRTDPGGKGVNVSKVIARLGGQSVALALAAGRTGEAIEDALRMLGIETDFLYGPGETRTNLKIVDPVLHQNTDVNEPGPQADPSAAAALLERLLSRLVPGDVVVLAGSLPRGLNADTYAVWTRACRAAGARVFLDADGEALAQGVMAGPSLVKPNGAELARLLGRELRTHAELAQAARTLTSRGVERVVVSLGAEGALFVDASSTVYAPGIPVPVGSTVGAGDSVVATLALAAERGMTAEETMRLAMATGAANVMCSGTQAASLEEVMALLPRVRLLQCADRNEP